MATTATDGDRLTEVALPKRWIEGVAAGDRTGDVATQVLMTRLGAVLQLLPLAAEEAEEDMEHIHQLRVWTRRAAAALVFYEELLPRRDSAWMKKQLKRIRRAVNDARDCDVLIERLKKRRATRETQHWLGEVRAERETAQKAVVRVYKRLKRGHRFARRVDKLLERMRSRDDSKARSASVPFGDWARQHLRPLIDKFFSAVPADQTDQAALHQFRIRGKQLRYAMELLGGAFPNEFQSRLYPAIECIQDQLGNINDLATAKRRLKKKLKETSDATEEASWRQLLAYEEQQFDRALQSFWAKYTPQMLHELHEAFAALFPNSRSTLSPNDRRRACLRDGRKAIAH